VSEQPTPEQVRDWQSLDAALRRICADMGLSLSEPMTAGQRGEFSSRFAEELEGQDRHYPADLNIPAGGSA
jgi:hypothetical protein